jgi:hypothetical protein
MNIKLHRLIKNATKEPIELSQREIGRVIGMARSAVGAWVTSELRDPNAYMSMDNDEFGFSSLKEFIEVTSKQEAEEIGNDFSADEGLTAIVHENGTRIITGTVGGGTLDASDLFKLVNLKEDEWVVQKLTVKPRTVGMKLRHESIKPDGSVSYIEVPHSHNVWSLHAELRPNTDVQVKVKSLERLLESLTECGPKGIIGRRLFNEGVPFQTPHCLVINIADLHLGKLAVDESWTIKDAMAEHERAVRFLLEQAGVYNIEEIIIWWGNDLTQTDNVRGQTTRGTQVESNASWYSQFDAGVELGIQTADICRGYCDHVYIHHVAGNHDWNTSYGICKSLQSYFAHSEDVTVKVYKHGVADHVYGKNFFMGVHGNNSTFKNAQGFMSVEYAEQWFKCPFREMHTGHLHKKDGGYFITEYAEDKGVTVRQAPSLSLTDGWHHLKTFVGTLRAAQCYLYSKNAGFKATFNWNADAHLNDN